MSKQESIMRYFAIIDKLRKYPADYDDIKHRLDNEAKLKGIDKGLSKRTFHRDIVDIREIFNIDIQCHKSNNTYYIDWEQPSEANERILEAFDIFNTFKLSEKLNDYISFEKRKPRGTEYLYDFLHAIKNNFIVTFTHHKFTEKHTTERRIEPYALKESKSRWYVLGKDKKDGIIKNFSIDRIKDLHVAKGTFKKPSDFNAQEYFKNCFGVMYKEADEVQRVVLAFNTRQGKFIKSMPLHESQRIISEDEKKVVIELNVYVTEDLMMELLYYCEGVKVLEPQFLADEVKRKLREAWEQY